MKLKAKNVCIASFLCFIVGFSSFAGEIKEDFDSQKLDTKLWKATTAGKASFEIENGKLILTSDGVSDGVFLYYARKIEKEDIIFEIALDPSGIKDAGAIGFTKKLLTPTLNTDINPQFIATFMGVKPIGCYLMDETGSAQLAMSANYDAEEHLFKTEIVGDKITFSIDGEDVGELKREAPERYYMITPDPYTSHYAGSVSIDWIKIKGPNVQSVELEAKLATTWGSIKRNSEFGVRIDNWHSISSRYFNLFRVSEGLLRRKELKTEIVSMFILKAITGESMMNYDNTLEEIQNPLPILADYPEYVEPLQYERRYLAPPVVNEEGGDLLVRSWRFWYNARGIIEMKNRLEAKATAIINVHPWGVDDGYGLKTPEPAGCAFFCTPEKNEFGLKHVQDVLNPLFRRLRGDVALIGHSMPGKEDDIRKLLYPTILTKPEEINAERGEKLLAELFNKHRFEGNPLKKNLTLDENAPVKSYFERTPSTDAGDYYNGQGFWQLPMPIVACLERGPNDMVFYDGEGYQKVCDYLKSIGVRHILLTGYAADMCVISTTCGYENMSQDFNVFLVGDATLATYPGSTTPKYATQVAVANAALRQMITQVNWIKLYSE